VPSPEELVTNMSTILEVIKENERKMKLMLIKSSIPLTKMIQ